MARRGTRCGSPAPPPRWPFCSAAGPAWLAISRRRASSRCWTLWALLPYAIPPVVVAIGALDLFVGRWGDVLDLRLVYVGVLAALLFPLVHQTLSAALQQLDARPLIDASRTLGASDGLLLRRVLLPMLLPAFAAAGLLAWTTAAMEFAIANLLLAGSLELLQPLVNGLRGANGHLAAALIVVSLAIVTLLGILVHLLTSWRTPARS